MRPRWTPEELLRLEGLCGDRPWPLVVENYNRWAKIERFPERSSLALERKAQQLGVYRKSEGTWITLGAISDILGIDRATPLRWVKRGIIRSWRNGEARAYPHYVRRDELRRLARSNPEFFRPYAHERLIMLFDAVAVADYVYERCPGNAIRKGRKRPVLCVETGRRFDSIKEAAQAAYVTSSRLWTVLDTNETANGLHWVTATPPRREATPNLTA